MLGNESHCWECEECKEFWMTTISTDIECKHCPFCKSDKVKDLGIL